MVARVIDHPFGTGVIPTPYNPDPVLLAIVEIIRDGLIRDQHVRLHNFGTFRLRWSKERQVKHPTTGARMRVAPTPRITFTPAKHLRELIDPDRKPSIPLGDIKISRLQDTQQIKIESITDKYHHGESQTVNELPNLTETIQNVIDENYSPSEQHVDDFQFRKEGNNKNPEISNKKWALGLLAAIPLILTLLQADFTADKNTHVDSAIATEISTAATQTNQDKIPDNLDNKPELNISNNVQPGSNSLVDVNGKSVASSHPEPLSNHFYMSPQLYTIQTGENLWMLAERFYGDALLWPHIFRANMRTISNPDKIISGRQLVIPGLQQAPDNLSNKDRELIAEGYYEVYQINRMKKSEQAIYFLFGARQFNPDWLIKMKSEIPRKDWLVFKN